MLKIVPRAESTLGLKENATVCGKSVEFYKNINNAKFKLNLETLENEKSEQRCDF